MIKKIYNQIRSSLPQKYQIELSKFVFRITDKPFFVNDENYDLKKGIVVVSADFELAWAWRYSKKKINISEIAERERNNFHIIINRLNELDIPITWATVGHLFLDSCKRENGKAHWDMYRPNYFENEYWKYKYGDWFDIDPCGNYKSDPGFYAPDLIEIILNSKTNHEIACHSFSHCDFSERNSYSKLIDAELSECRKSMDKFGIRPVSFVFPGNLYGSFDHLKKAGFKIIRYKANDSKELGYPEILKNGLMAIHDSIALDVYEDGWDNNYLLWKYKKYIDKAIDKKAICHFWFHPSLQYKQLEEYFLPILNYIHSQRENGKLEVLTMEQLITL